MNLYEKEKISNQTEIIDRIENVRKLNNSLWMELLRISLEKAPTRTKAILAEIKKNDQLISKNMEELAK
jgi:hypothetical protein